MRVVITGSEGYLGCVLWKALKAAGHQVRGIDRGLYGVRNTDDDHTLSVADADAVVNLAALVGEPVCIANPIHAEKWNVGFAAMQLQHAVKCRVKTFIHISTCSVYGKRPADSILHPEDCVDDGVGLPPYARTKRAAELKLLGCDHGDTRVHIVRLGTMCGPSPRMRFDLMANGFCLGAARRKRVVIYNPESIRPHVSVRAVASMIVWLLEHGDGCPVLMNYVGESHTVGQLAETVAKPAFARVEVDASKAVDDSRSYRVACSPELAHLPDGVLPSLEYVSREVYHYRWAGARPDSPHWGNTGWRWE